MAREDCSCCDVAMFRKHLNDWIERRSSLRLRAQQFKFSFDIPKIPLPPPRIVGYDEYGKPILDKYLVRRRCDISKEDQDVIGWECLPHRKGLKAED